MTTNTYLSKGQIQDFYRIKKDKFVGQGRFGEIYACEKLGEANANKYCVKLIPLGQGKINKYEDSINIQLQNYFQEHPEFINFVKTYDIFQHNMIQYIVMELCDEDLESEFSRMIEYNTWYSEEEVFDIIRQIIRGFNHLYKLNIIHRDIKPENILIKKEEGQTKDKKIYKIGDFGVGRLVDDINSKIYLTRQGTMNYCAPQLLFNQQFTAKCDIFSYGILFYQICYQGQLPYDCSSKQKLYQNLKQLISNPFKAPALPYSRADVLKDLIEKMIVYDEDRRASFEQVFNHEVMKVTGIEDTVFIQNVLNQNPSKQIQNQGSSLLNIQQYQERKKMQNIIQEIQMLQIILEIFYNRFKLCSYFLKQIESNQQQQQMHMIIQIIAKHQLEYALAMIYIRPFEFHPKIKEDNDQLDLIQKLHQIQKRMQEHKQQFQEVIQFQKKIQATYHKFVNSILSFQRQIYHTQLRNYQCLDKELTTLCFQSQNCKIEISYLINRLKNIQQNFSAFMQNDLQELLDKIINIETNYPLNLWKQDVELNKIFPLKIQSYEYLS